MQNLWLSQSRLDNIVLDRQTFYNVFKNELSNSLIEVIKKLPINCIDKLFPTHFDVREKLYRAEWMKLLVDTENPKLQ